MISIVFLKKFGDCVITESYKFCPICASALRTEKIDGTYRPRCLACRRIIYFDPKLATTVVINRDDSFLMIKRATQPGIGLWAFPGGHVDRGEVVENAAVREVLEETGLVVEITAALGIFSEEQNPVVLAAFAGKEIGGYFRINSEVSDIGFFRTEDFPPLAFPRDLQVLRAWDNLNQTP
jgi:ADP-ribose pyrophosphatase YjhB (NUDIX family)